MKTLNLLAMDYGASNGRGIVGFFDGESLRMKELHRFENDFVVQGGLRYWNSSFLFAQIGESIDRFAAQYGSALHGIGIDTWGVDYGLIDRDGKICGLPISYRSAVDEDCETVWRIVPRRTLFDRTGVATHNFNTVYQLYARKRRGDPALESADKLLLLPDMFAYFLTGAAASEYTNTTTTQLYNPVTKDWDWQTIDALELPRHIFPPVQNSCVQRGQMYPSYAAQHGIDPAPVLSIGSHDTASAVAAVPGHGNFAYISSGTWSLLGIETDEAIRTDAAFDAGYSNEGTIQGGFRPLRNIMGLWLIQQCRRQWLGDGLPLSWDDICTMADGAPQHRALIDPDFPAFFAAEDMIGAIRDFCVQTGQTPPQTVGEVARCVYESLALEYRWAIERIEAIRGGAVDVIYIVGGGSQNKLLNQMTANATGKCVVAGPIEGACIGNLLGQAMALGEINGVSQMRDVVRRSFDVEDYAPRDAQSWQDAYGRFLQIKQRDV